MTIGDVILHLLGFNVQLRKKAGRNDSVIHQLIDPKDVLFTVATIENTLPAFVEKTHSANLSFHEDEWRQLEFISKTHKAAIESAFEGINDIYDNHLHNGGDYIAYKNVFVRKLINEPLRISFSKLKSYMSHKELAVGGVSMYNNPGEVMDGFSFTANGIRYYGIVQDGVVKTLGLFSFENQSSLKTSVDNVYRLLKNEQLYLVDWKARRMISEANLHTSFGIVSGTGVDNA